MSASQPKLSDILSQISKGSKKQSMGKPSTGGNISSVRDIHMTLDELIKMEGITPKSHHHTTIHPFPSPNKADGMTTGMQYIYTNTYCT